MPTATVELQEDGKKAPVRDAATGDGPVDAIFRVMERITGVKLELKDYQLRAVTGGKEAQGEVRLEALCGKQTVSGRGVSTDVLEASAKAYLSAINRAVSRTGGARRAKRRPKAAAKRNKPKSGKAKRSSR